MWTVKVRREERGAKVEVRLKEKIPGVFWPVHQAIRRGEVTEVVAKGGRGSGKSSYLSMELVWQLLRHPDCHAVVLRKVGGTLRNSVYNQIVWAIGELGCAGYFRCTVSPMECTYLPTGQKILFFGTDDPGKLKSLKLPFGAVGICWFEELDQFDGPEEVRNVEQTVLRGGSWTLTLKSFNPPAMARSWANRYALETRPGKLVHHSTYRDLPRAMLGERFWADAEHLQRTNPAAFRHEYGGEVVGSGAAVCRLACDKGALAEALQAYHNLTEDLVTATVPQTLTLSRRAFELWGMEAALSLVESRFPGSFPLCVKPASGSSAEGGSRGEEAEQLAEALREALKICERGLVQPWVEGVQLSVPVIGTGWNAFALPPVEIVAKEGWYDAAARQASDAVELHVPVRNASLSPSEADAQAIRAEIERAVLETYRALGMRDCGCIDLIWDGAQAIILEAVANPCSSAEAPFAPAAKAAGPTLPNLPNELVDSAFDA